MQGRAYKLVRQNVATSTAITILQVKVPTTTMIELVRFELTVATTTSATNRIQILKKSAAATVTAQSPQSVGTNYGASLCVSGTAATGITATAEGTDSTVLLEANMNSLNGYLALWVPEERIPIEPGEIVAVKFPSAPTSANWTAELTWLEY